jgi:NADH-quinone oxidoreductase subunit C
MMDFAGILKVIEKNGLADYALINSEAGQPFVHLKASKLKKTAKLLYGDKDLQFDFLRCLSGVDEKDKFLVVYHLYSYRFNHEFIFKVELPKENPIIDTVSDIWGIANWYERETFDLMGIIFEGHPDPRRIMLPDDWDGHPLRKDYKEPLEYGGISHKR